MVLAVQARPQEEARGQEPEEEAAVLAEQARPQVKVRGQVSEVA